MAKRIAAKPQRARKPTLAQTLTHTVAMRDAEIERLNDRLKAAESRTRWFEQSMEAEPDPRRKRLLLAFAKTFHHLKPDDVDKIERVLEARVGVVMIDADLKGFLR